MNVNQNAVRLIYRRHIKKGALFAQIYIHINTSFKRDDMHIPQREVRIHGRCGWIAGKAEEIEKMEFPSLLFGSNSVKSREKKV